MPAAAVIPAPIAYTKVVAVKKLVVGFLETNLGPFLTECVLSLFVAIFEFNNVSDINLLGMVFSSFTVSKLECSKQAYAVEYISME